MTKVLVLMALQPSFLFFFTDLGTFMVRPINYGFYSGKCRSRRDKVFFFFFLSYYLFIYFGSCFIPVFVQLKQYCNSVYNKLNSLQQKEFINITKMNYIWK